MLDIASPRLIVGRFSWPAGQAVDDASPEAGKWIGREFWGTSGSNKLEVPTTYKAYARPKFQGISQENVVLYSTVAPF